MSDLQARMVDVIKGHAYRSPRVVAAAIIAELALDTETSDLPVFVEEVPRRMVQRGLEEVPAKQLHFIPHTHYTSPWYGPDCPDCQDEFGVHDRRHAEIIADSLR